MYTVRFPTTRQDVEGGYLITGVPLLVEGTWNGITYTAEQLAANYGNWRDNSVWNRHYEGRKRDETNRVGLIKNQRYGDRAIIGDVFLSNETDEGKNMIHFVRTNQINGISVEHVNIDVPIEGKMFATDISFLGAAVVPTPACTVCQLSKEELSMEQKDFDKLSGVVAELAKDVKELTKVDVETIVKEQSEKDSKTIKELMARVKKLEDLPEAGTTQSGAGIEDSYAGLVVEHGKTHRSGE